MAETPETPEQLVERIARTCHEVNRAYCTGLGDTSQVPWEEAPDWQKDSARAGVISTLQSGRTPPEGHAAWMVHKLAEGWTYGEEKDAEKKTHPCIMPYEKLPVAQQAKDSLFHTVIAGMVGI